MLVLCLLSLYILVLCVLLLSLLKITAFVDLHCLPICAPVSGLLVHLLFLLSALVLVWVLVLSLVTQ